MEALIITNNPKVNKELKEQEKIEFYPDADQEEILRIARDYIHLGAKLIMHPMMGRIKPHETPYKSVFLERIEGSTDLQSVIIIEDSLSLIHISEPTRQAEISYAVFCLKKKNQKKHNT